MFKQFSEFSNVVGYKVNTLKSNMFIYTSDKNLENIFKNRTIYNNKQC